MYLLGYDLGSSALKAALVESQTQRVVCSLSYPETEMDISAPQPGWAEQDPALWWQHLCILTQKLLHQSGVDPQDIKALGLAYQMHGLVLVDKNNQVLRPAIIWCDSRAVGIGREALAALGEDYCFAALLNGPGNFTASKLKWVKDNEPEIYARIHKILLPGDYLALRLTGLARTTVTGLSEGIFWDFSRDQLSQPLLGYFGFSRELIPELVPVFGHQGSLTREAAEMTGLQAGIPLTYRAGDQPNNALSLNVVRPGEIAATGGTSGVVYGVFDRPVYDVQSRINAFAHVNHQTAAPRIGALLCINGAGSQYRWIKSQVAQDGLGYQDMESRAAAIPAGADGLCILPFGNGSERMLGDENVQAHVLNLDFNRHTRDHLYRAALEAVAFSFVYGIQVLKSMGLSVRTIRVGNDNLFQSRVFATTIASLLDLQIEIMETTGAVGAARASGLASGAYASMDEALNGVRRVETLDPDPERVSYGQAFERWQRMLEHFRVGTKQPL